MNHNIYIYRDQLRFSILNLFTTTTTKNTVYDESYSNILERKNE